MSKFFLNLKWGLTNPNTPFWNTRFQQLEFQWTQNALHKCSPSLVLAKPSTKNGFIFLEAILDFTPSHEYLHLGNLNPINILKCPNNLEGIFRMLRIFSNMPLNIFRFFLNGIVFLLFQNTEQKQIKRKTESREETYLAAHLAA